MHPELHAVVEDAYEVFGEYRVRHLLSVCHCNSCMSVEHERELLKTPLREVPAGLLAEYTGSAHSWDDGPVACEMRYFLPRYFDLIAQNDPPDNTAASTSASGVSPRQIGEPNGPTASARSSTGFSQS